MCLTAAQVMIRQATRPHRPVCAGLDDGGAYTVAQGDSYISVENLIGSAFNDTLYGNRWRQRSQGWCGH